MRHKKQVLQILLGCCVMVVGLFAWVLDDDRMEMTPAASISVWTIATDAVSNGLLPAMIYGTLEERHDFAKSYPTRFGQMNHDIDDYLKYEWDWSEKQIHDAGSRLGFSGPWRGE